MLYEIFFLGQMSVWVCAVGYVTHIRIAFSEFKSSLSYIARLCYIQEKGKKAEKKIISLSRLEKTGFYRVNQISWDKNSGSTLEINGMTDVTS